MGPRTAQRASIDERRIRPTRLHHNDDGSDIQELPPTSDDCISARGDDCRSARDTISRLRRYIEERLHMTVIASKLIEGDGAPIREAPIRVRGKNQLERR
jgi:hypothetical protein